MRKLTERKKHPHYVRLPKGAASPTNSIYKHFDIVRQTRVVITYSDKAGIVRCAEPFTLQVKLASGKIKQLDSRKE